MATMYNSKIVFYGETLIDLTGDTAAASDVLAGKTIHDKTGAPVTGTCTFDSDTSNDTAAAGEILSGKTAHVKGAKVTGSMPNKGGMTLKVAAKGTDVTIPAGYHDGSGKATLDETEAAKLIPDNIRESITIFGVTGTMSGTEGANPQAKTVTPAKTQQEVLPDEGYNYLSSVTVLAVPISYTDNSAGGQTVTIGV